MPATPVAGEALGDNHDRGEHGVLGRMWNLIEVVRGNADAGDDEVGDAPN